jgi:hypothetical protein
MAAWQEASFQGHSWQLKSPRGCPLSGVLTSSVPSAPAGQAAQKKPQAQQLPASVGSQGLVGTLEEPGCFSQSAGSQWHEDLPGYPPLP